MPLMRVLSGCLRNGAGVVAVIVVVVVVVLEVEVVVVVVLLLLLLLVLPVAKVVPFCSWQRQTFGGSFVVGSLRFGVHMGERLPR